MLKYFIESYHQTERKHEGIGPGSKQCFKVFEDSTIAPEI